MLLTLVWELLWLGLYLQNPLWPAMMGSLVYYADWSLPIHTAVIFPISLTWIMQQIQKGKYPDHRKLLDLEITRLSVIVILNIIGVQSSIFRIALGNHCLAVFTMGLLKQCHCRYLKYAILSLDLIYLFLSWIPFWPNFTHVLIVWSIIWLNSAIHLELTSSKEMLCINNWYGLNKN